MNKKVVEATKSIIGNVVEISVGMVVGAGLAVVVPIPVKPVQKVLTRIGITAVGIYVGQKAGRHFRANIDEITHTTIKEVENTEKEFISES